MTSSPPPRPDRSGTATSFRFDPETWDRLERLRARFGERHNIAVIRLALETLDATPGLVTNQEERAALQRMERQITGACANLNQTVRAVHTIRLNADLAANHEIGERVVDRIVEEVDTLARDLDAIRAALRPFTHTPIAPRPVRVIDAPPTPSPSRPQSLAPSLHRLDAEPARGKRRSLSS
jgi:predicted transcriptional regulator